jgi:hypothetical protein
MTTAQTRVLSKPDPGLVGLFALILLVVILILPH